MRTNVTDALAMYYGHWCLRYETTTCSNAVGLRNLGLILKKTFKNNFWNTSGGDNRKKWKEMI